MTPHFFFLFYISDITNSSSFEKNIFGKNQCKNIFARKSLNGNYLVLFKNPQDKLQILTLAKKSIQVKLLGLSKSTKRRCEPTTWVSRRHPALSKSFVFPTFFFQTETEFSNFSSLKNVLEKHSFRDGLLWVVEIKLR